MKPTLLTLSAALFVAGCERENPQPAPAPVQSTENIQIESPQESALRLVFLGDSLTAGLGVEQDEAFPALIGKALEAEGIHVRIVNAGVSGDTSAGGESRLNWLLKQPPDLLIVGLGANDGLRGNAIQDIANNLRSILIRARDAGVPVLLLGMMIPPNYGPEYTAEFRDIYPKVAGEFNVPLVPFLLDGVGGEVSFNQSDGIHPTAEGHRIIADTVLPYIKPMLHPTTQPVRER